MQEKKYYVVSIIMGKRERSCPKIKWLTVPIFKKKKTEKNRKM